MKRDRAKFEAWKRRSAPLRRKAQMKPSGGYGRPSDAVRAHPSAIQRKPMRKVSKKQAQRQRAYRPIRAKVLAEQRTCWFERELRGGCWGRMEVHHKLSRARGGADETDNLVVLCAKHHDDTHHTPVGRRFAEAHGLLLAEGGRDVSTAIQLGPPVRGVIESDVDSGAVTAMWVEVERDGSWERDDTYIAALEMSTDGPAWAFRKRTQWELEEMGA